MAGGHDNRDDPDLPKLRRFRLGPDGSPLAPMPAPNPISGSNAPGDGESGSALDDDTTILDFDQVSDEFDEGDLRDARTTQFPATAPPLPAARPGPITPPPGPIPPTRSATSHVAPAASHPGLGTPTPPQQPPASVVPDSGGGAGKKGALWAAGAAAIVIVLAAFVLIAKPFSNDAPARQDGAATSSSTSRPANRDSGSAETSPTVPNGAAPGRVPPNTSGLPAPGSPRPADPDKWASNICSAFGEYEVTAAALIEDVENVGNSSVADAKMSKIAQQGNGLLSGLRTSLAGIVDGEGNDGLTKLQGAVTTATNDAAASIDPANPDNKAQSADQLGDEVKDALAQPKSTLKSEVAKLHKDLRDTIHQTKSCKPLAL